MHGSGAWGRPPQLFRDVVPPLLLAVLLLVATNGEAHAVKGTALGAGGYLLVAAAALSLALRRPLPPVAFALSTVFAASFLLAGFPPGPILLAPFLGLLAVFASTRSRLLWAVSALSGAVVLGAVHGIVDGWGYDILIFAAVWLAVAFVAAVVLDARQRFIAEVRARSRWAERTREEASRRHLVEERLRIAREMHDVLGHSLAVITLQAGVAERFLDSRPEEARRAVTAIRSVSKQALGELRTELAMLRGEEPNGADRAPVPDMTTIPALAAQMRDAGLEVHLHIQASRTVIPEIVSRAAYRIVQESLTNVARHAGPGAAATVSAAVEDGALQLEISDSGGGRPATAEEGAGIEGMRERVAALGGTFAATNRSDGAGFVVQASLPVSR